MVDPNVQEAKVTNVGQAEAREGQPASGQEGRPATLADTLAAGLSEFFTRRRQSRPGIYAPLVRLERSE